MGRAQGSLLSRRFPRATHNAPAVLPAHGIVITGRCDCGWLDAKGNHNGGDLLFDEAGMLLLFTGDGGSGGDPHGLHGNGQDPTSLLGKALRIDVSDTSVAYKIPSDNPFVGDFAADDRIWALGLRNPWRCTRDDATGNIFCGDVGQSAHEEVNIVVRGGNYGWRGREGPSCYNNDPQCTKPNLRDPIFSYTHSTFGKSVTGGFVYRGCVYPELYGTYLFADYVSRRVFALRRSNTTAEVNSTQAWDFEEVQFGSPDGCPAPLRGLQDRPHILSFGQDEAGDLYMLTTEVRMPA